MVLFACFDGLFSRKRRNSLSTSTRRRRRGSNGANNRSTTSNPAATTGDRGGRRTAAGRNNNQQTSGQPAGQAYETREQRLRRGSELSLALTSSTSSLSGSSSSSDAEYGSSAERSNAMPLRKAMGSSLTSGDGSSRRGGRRRGGGGGGKNGGEKNGKHPARRETKMSEVVGGTTPSSGNTGGSGTGGGGTAGSNDSKNQQPLQLSGITNSLVCDMTNQTQNATAHYHNHSHHPSGYLANTEFNQQSTQLAVSGRASSCSATGGSSYVGYLQQTVCGGGGGGSAYRDIDATNNFQNGGVHPSISLPNALSGMRWVGGGVGSSVSSSPRAAAGGVGVGVGPIGGVNTPPTDPTRSSLGVGASSPASSPRGYGHQNGTVLLLEGVSTTTTASGGGEEEQPAAGGGGDTSNSVSAHSPFRSLSLGDTYRQVVLHNTAASPANNTNNNDTSTNGAVVATALKDPSSSPLPTPTSNASSSPMLTGSAAGSPAVGLGMGGWGISNENSNSGNKNNYEGSCCSQIQQQQCRLMFPPPTGSPQMQGGQAAIGRTTPSSNAAIINGTVSLPTAGYVISGTGTVVTSTIPADLQQQPSSPNNNTPQSPTPQILSHSLGIRRPTTASPQQHNLQHIQLQQQSFQRVLKSGSGGSDNNSHHSSRASSGYGGGGRGNSLTSGAPFQFGLLDSGDGGALRKAMIAGGGGVLNGRLIGTPPTAASGGGSGGGGGSSGQETPLSKGSLPTTTTAAVGGGGGGLPLNCMASGGSSIRAFALQQSLLYQQQRSLGGASVINHSNSTQHTNSSSHNGNPHHHHQHEGSSSQSISVALSAGFASFNLPTGLMTKSQRQLQLMWQQQPTATETQGVAGCYPTMPLPNHPPLLPPSTTTNSGTVSQGSSGRHCVGPSPPSSQTPSANHQQQQQAMLLMGVGEGGGGGGGANLPSESLIRTVGGGGGPPTTAATAALMTFSGSSICHLKGDGSVRDSRGGEGEGDDTATPGNNNNNDPNFLRSSTSYYFTPGEDIIGGGWGDGGHRQSAIATGTRLSLGSLYSGVTESVRSAGAGGLAGAGACVVSQTSQRIELGGTCVLGGGGLGDGSMESNTLRRHQQRHQQHHDRSSSVFGDAGIGSVSEYSYYAPAEDVGGVGVGVGGSNGGRALIDGGGGNSRRGSRRGSNVSSVSSAGGASSPVVVFGRRGSAVLSNSTNNHATTNSSTNDAHSKPLDVSASPSQSPMSFAAAVGAATQEMKGSYEYPLNGCGGRIGDDVNSAMNSPSPTTHTFVVMRNRGGVDVGGTTPMPTGAVEDHLESSKTPRRRRHTRHRFSLSADDDDEDDEEDDQGDDDPALILPRPQ